MSAMFEDAEREAKKKIRQMLSEEPKQTINVQVPDSLYRTLKFVAWEKRVTQTQVLQKLIRESFPEELNNIINPQQSE